MRNKKGLFKISYNYLTKDGVFEDLCEVFSKLKFVTLYLDNNYMCEIITYYGISPLFDEVKEGQTIPEYTIVINKSEEGELDVKVEKTKKELL